MAARTNMSRMLSERAVWQDRANSAGSDLERVVHDVLAEYLQGDDSYSLEVKPKHLRGAYRERWGPVPDLAIGNRVTGKRIWIEIKQQNAAGNAHERACKFLSPGLVRYGADLAGVPRPFFFIFAGGIVDTPEKSDKYHAEIDRWFDADGWHDHVLKWRNHDPVSLCQWFTESILPVIE